MPDPHDTLSIFAEVSVALAGFSGIAIALGGRSLGSLTKLETRRLFNLFAFSGLVLIISLLGISFLHYETLASSFIWRGGSAVMFLIGVPWLFFDWRKVASLDSAERSQVPNSIFYAFTVIAVILFAVQLVNALFLGQAAPFFLALVLAVSFAFQQFVLLVRMGVRDA